MFARVLTGARRGFASKSSGSKEVTFKLARPFKGHRCDVPAAEVTTTKDELIAFYTQMVQFRRVEIVADTLYKSREIRGFCHLYDGQEAVLVGLEANLHKTDSIITAYRAHCHQLSRGDTMESMFSELMGKVTGCSRGKGGSMHTYFPKNNFYGGNGIVGAQVPLGAGVAWAHKMKNDGGVCVAAYGDGAANQGQVFEAANMAMLWKLPCIFLTENNNYAMGTATKRHAACTDFYTRGDYVPGIWLDGMDVLASKAGFQYAVDHCRSGKGPIFVEASTYRYHGHSMSDPGISYRSRDEVAEVRAQRDCIENTKARILEAGFATANELKAIDKQIREEVDVSVKKAQAAGFPELKELFEHIYTGEEPPYIRNVEKDMSIGK